MNSSVSRPLISPSSCFLVMGVSGSGKSHIGRQLANETGATFIDGDDYHSSLSIAKMSRGEPLSDNDRKEWLETLAALFREHRQNGEPVIIGCSALKRRYRDILRQGAPGLRILYLHGERDILLKRLNSRGDHFFNGEHMLNSQLDTLEIPGDDEAIRCNIEQMPAEIIQQFLARIQQ
ncbi:gluconokinase [Halomonas huangheensis]|nr:gluconokinase [Halomonas huangheensis]